MYSKIKWPLSQYIPSLARICNSCHKNIVSTYYNRKQYYGSHNRKWHGLQIRASETEVRSFASSARKAKYAPASEIVAGEFLKAGGFGPVLHKILNNLRQVWFSNLLKIIINPCIWFLDFMILLRSIGVAIITLSQSVLLIVVSRSFNCCSPYPIAGRRVPIFGYC